MKSLGGALAFIGTFAVAVSAVAVATLITSDRQEDRVLFLVLGPVIGWAFVATGLFAWLRRPENRTGALMTGVGITFFLGGYSWSGDPVLFTIGMVFGSTSYGVLVHLFLAFPTGRLEGSWERRMALLGYGLTFGVPLFLAFFHETRGSELCPGCRENPILISNQQDLSEAVLTGYAVASVLGLIGVFVLVRRHWRRSSAAHRRAFQPLRWVILAVLVSVSLGLAGVATSQEGTSFSAIAGVAGLFSFAAVPFAFLVGLLRGRLSRAAAVDALIGQLGRERASVRDLLAGALDDPELELAYWARDQSRYVDARGEPVELPAPGGERVVAEVTHEGRPVAVLIHAALQDEPELIETVCAAAALALENERLHAELRARVAEVRASRARLVEASDEARRRLERDLHDGAQQRLVALSVNLRLARSALDRDPAAAAELLDECSAELKQATEELRELARGIHPAVLTDRGLDAAVGALAARASVPVEVHAVPEERLPAPVEAAAYFVVAEALTNVARYADATHAEVRVERVNGHVTVDVSDDGKGGADPSHGSGLRGLTDRLAALDGTLEVESRAGAGTRVHAEIPCGS